MNEHALDFARHIASAILNAGSKHHGTATRIELKVYSPNNGEASNGGLCELALVNVIYNSIIEKFGTEDE